MNNLQKLIENKKPMMNKYDHVVKIDIFENGTKIGYNEDGKIIYWSES